MKHVPEHIDEGLLVKYLLGEAGTEERRDIELWLAASPANRRQYDEMAIIWERSRELAGNSDIDEDAAWDRFRQRVRATEHAGTARTIDLRPEKRTLRIAAAALLLVALGWAAYYFSNAVPEVIALEAGSEPLTDTLPDGSVIRLNSHASLRYPSRFAGNARKVTLNGEAFFEISADKSKPFIITANGINVTVVGTSFNVRSSPAKTEVVVATGIVEVRKKAEAVTLHPHEQAVVLQADARPVKTGTDDLLYHFYRTREFTFDNTPLWRVVAVLNEAYDTRIVIGDAGIRDRPISTSFRQEPIENILQVVGETLRVRYEQQGNEYLLMPR